jgi:predicted DNA-binding transcriptional regulator AlpA
MTRPSAIASPEAATPLVAPLLSIADLTHILNAGRATVERLKSSGKLPKPDLKIGRMPRWKPETIRRWIDEGGA